MYTAYYGRGCNRPGETIGCARHRWSIAVYALTIIAFVVALPGLSGAQKLGPGSWIHVFRHAPSNPLATLIAGPDGSLWTGDTDRMYSFAGDRWSIYEYGDQELTNHAPFFLDSRGRFFFIDNNILAVLDGLNVTKYPEMSIGFPAVADEAPDGSVYIASSSSGMGGLFRLSDAGLEKVRTGVVKTVAVGADGTVWATTHESGASTMSLYSAVEGEWADRTAEIQSLFPVRNENLVVQTAPDGAIWVGNTGKYSVYRDESWTYHNGGGSTVFFYFGSDSTIWGFGNHTIYRMDGRGDWVVFYNRKNYIFNTPNFMALLPDGSPVTFDNEKLYRYDGIRWNEIVATHDLASDTVTTLAYDYYGNLICGHGLRNVPDTESENAGISVRNGDDWEFSRKFDDVSFYDVYQLKKMPDDNIMTYTDGGFKLRYGLLWEEVDSLMVFNQRDMVWNDEAMWIGTDRGIVEYHDPEPDFDFHFPMDGQSPSPCYNMMFIDENVIYMQVGNGNLVRFDTYEMRWSVLSFEGTSVNDFTVDDTGLIWAARKDKLATFDIDTRVWTNMMTLDYGRLAEKDDMGRIWVSGNGVFGYYFENQWYPIDALNEYSCDAIAFSADGRIAVNAFDRDRKTFYGIFEFQPLTGVEPYPDRPSGAILTSAHPNPFNARTMITFDISSMAKTKVDIFTLTGQRIRTLVDHMYPPGNHRVFWDGRSDDGTKVASGVFIYSIISGGRTATGKVTLVK